MNADGQVQHVKKLDELEQRCNLTVHILICLWLFVIFKFNILLVLSK